MASCSPQATLRSKMISLLFFTSRLADRSRYYANISQGDWEGEEPSERPFLMVILPEIAADGTVSAKTGFLAPHFEEGRARMLPVPSKEKDLDIVVWEEEWSPYETLRKSRLFQSHPTDARPKLMIEEEMRDFIVRGLDAASFDTVGLNSAAELVKQRKSPAEIEIMRAVNTGTLAAVRAMRRCLEPGLTENDVKQVYSDAVRSIGFEPTFTVVLFDENAAQPHGGLATGSKKLTETTMILTDVGAHYLGYSSDVTRSFMLNKPSSKSGDDPLLAQKQEVWQVVYEAQTSAMLAMVSNATAAEVDIAARTVIEHAGYGYAFTHRLGHSIGIKGHESPYLSKWNKNTRLQQGMVFTDEPGIYLEQRFGVRLEDVFVVTEDGEPELLTGGRAKSIYEP